MSNFESIVSSSNFPLLIIAIGFVVSGIAVLGVSAFVSLRTRTTSED